METRKWEHLIISPDYVPPLLETEKDAKGRLKTGRTLGQIYSSSELFENCGVNMSLSWFYEIPAANPFVDEHVHDVDELVFFLPAYCKEGDDLEVEWGEAEFYIEGESYTITKNTCIYCPAGVKHGPIIYKRIIRPHCFQTILLSSKYVREEDGKTVTQIDGQYVEAEE